MKKIFPLARGTRKKVFPKVIQKVYVRDQCFVTKIELELKVGF